MASVDNREPEPDGACYLGREACMGHSEQSPHFGSAGEKGAQPEAADVNDVREARQAWAAPSSRLSTSSDTATPPSPGEQGPLQLSLAGLPAISMPSSQVLMAGSFYT